LRFAHIYTVILFYFIELTMLLSASFTCLDACCHGLRLPVFNKETTYLLTYLMRSSSRWRRQHSSSATRTQPTDAANSRVSSDMQNVSIRLATGTFTTANDTTAGEEPSMCRVCLTSHAAGEMTMTFRTYRQSLTDCFCHHSWAM